MDLIVTITVPRNILSLCCGKKKDYSSAGVRYNLKERDPDYLRSLLNLVYQANPNQFDIKMRVATRKTEKALMQYNQANSDNLTLVDLVKHVNWDNYKHSVLSTQQGYEGEEFHVFKNVDVPGFTPNRDHRLYIKFVDTDGKYPIQVMSVHRNMDDN